MIHALIVGPRGCGASELIQEILKTLNRPVVGFITKKEMAFADESNGEPVYIYEPGKPRQQSGENLLGYCKQRRFHTIAGAFDRYALKLNRFVPDGHIFLMDELGFMESQEEAFCQAVLQRLDGDTLVIASVKDKDFPFLHTVRNHPKCRCFYLTPHNREAVFQEVIHHMSAQLAGSQTAKLPAGMCPGTNLEDLNLFLSLQETTFPSSPQYTAGKWNKRADFWEMERKLQRKNDERVDKTLAFLQQRGILTPECRIADIGCGPGRFAAAFARQCSSVVGFDISSRMVEHGNAYIQNLGLENARLHCCDFSQLDIDAEGYRGSFDLVFSSLTPAIHNVDGLIKSMEMSRAWCLNISHLRRHNHLRERILAEVFMRSPERRGEGRIFYALFNTLFLLGYQPETSFMTRRKETRVRPDEEYVAYIMEQALPMEEHTKENSEKILKWLKEHTEEDGFLTEISDAVYGRILWDVREQNPRPDYRCLIK